MLVNRTYLFHFRMLYFDKYVYTFTEHLMTTSKIKL
jgi:hypothetical protein